MVACPLRFAATCRARAATGSGRWMGGLAEVKTYFLGADFDVLGGEAADGCRSLGVEEKEEAGEAVLRFEGVVVEETACDMPTMFVIERLGGAVPADGGDVDCGELVGAGPADEVPRVVAVGCRVVGEPPLKVRLLASLQCELGGRQPVEEGYGCSGPLTCGNELLRGEGLASFPSSESPDEVPDRVPLQDFAVLGVLRGCEEAGQEAFEAGHVLVPLRQGADAHEDLPEVGEGWAVG